MFEVRARFYRRVESSFFIDVNLFIDATCRHSRAGDKTFDNYINHSGRGEGGEGLLFEGADDCVALFKRDTGKSIARLSVGNLA